LLRTCSTASLEVENALDRSLVVERRSFGASSVAKFETFEPTAAQA